MKRGQAVWWLDFHKCCRHCVGKFLQVLSVTDLIGVSHWITSKLKNTAGTCSGSLSHVHSHQHLNMHTFNAEMEIHDKIKVSYTAGFIRLEDMKDA